MGGTYRRSLRLPGGPGIAELTPARGHVEARYRLSDGRDLDQAVRLSRANFDLDCDPAPIVEVLRSDPLLGEQVAASPGRRVPGSVDGHELAVRAVLGQQVSLRSAATLARRLVVAYGEPLEERVGGVTHLFPSAAALAEANADHLAMPESRRRCLVTLAGALARSEVDVDIGADRVETSRRLLELPGIGPWTTSYIAMRALRDPDAFLPTDLGVRHALSLLGCPPGTDIIRLADRWRPYRAYAIPHLWALVATAH